MPQHNAGVAALLDETADLLEIAGANAYRVRAYRRAARTVEALPRALTEMLAGGSDLTKLPGVGADLAQKIEDAVRTGRMAALDEARRKVPEGLVALLALPGLGPKRVKKLHDELGVKDLATLQRALSAGRVRALEGFGAKTEARLLEAIPRAEAAPKRHLLAGAEQIVAPLVAYLREAGARDVEVAGSFRRRRETVGDLDLLATAARPARLMDAFVGHEDVREVLSKGRTRSTVVLSSGMQVDLRVVPRESLGAALHYFTGSKAHNIAVRRRAQERGLKLNEYGVFRGERRVGGSTEASVFRAVGLPFVPPELREERGEIEAAQARKLPELVELSDLRGDLQSHTTESDGRASLEEMAEAARAMGHEYLAVTDHGPRVTMAHGLDARRLRAQAKRIDRLNARLEGLTLLKGVEVDILKDGRLDLPDKVLAEMDVVVCSLHYHLDLPRDQQTERVLRAMERPHAHILGHPTGRLLGQREGARLDMGRVLDAAAEQGWFVEIDSQPDRLDLTDAHARMAKERGVKVAIDTDAHSVDHLRNLRFGVDQARRGWLEKGDVLNTRTLRQLRKLLSR